jgi:hypothetical protein
MIGRADAGNAGACDQDVKMLAHDNAPARMLTHLEPAGLSQVN